MTLIWLAPGCHHRFRTSISLTGIFSLLVRRIKPISCNNFLSGQGQTVLSNGPATGWPLQFKTSRELRVTPRPPEATCGNRLGWVRLGSTAIDELFTKRNAASAIFGSPGEVNLKRHQGAHKLVGRDSAQ